MHDIYASSNDTGMSYHIIFVLLCGVPFFVFAIYGILLVYIFGAVYDPILYILIETIALTEVGYEEEEINVHHPHSEEDVASFDNSR